MRTVASVLRLAPPALAVITLAACGSSLVLPGDPVQSGTPGGTPGAGTSPPASASPTRPASPAPSTATSPTPSVHPPTPSASHLPTAPASPTPRASPTPPASPTPTPPSDPAVRFVALGDTGEGNADQLAVARVIGTVCAAQGCDLALLLGDNFYDIGVDGTDDPQWSDKFEVPYAHLDFRFHAVLGNHDGGSELLGGTGLDAARGNHQVDYTALSDKWYMPARWYKYTQAHVDFFALDSSAIFFDGLWFTDFSDMTDSQARWLQSEWAGGSRGTWRIAYAHHPYRSNGPHGNAGRYEGLPGIPFVSGGSIETFLEENVCGRVDLYLCGHDHSRQWLADTCEGTHLMVSGAGSKTTGLDGDNPVSWQDETTEGFVWIEIAGRTLRAQWWDKNGVMNYEGSWSK
jgi:hypothetical protein